MSIIVEIRAAEGGEDARLLVREQLSIYSRLAERQGFSIELLEERSGSVVLRASGKGAEAAFKNEPGGHRVQRIPANERRGRVHSSTITVAVLREPAPTELRIDDRDLEWSTCRSSGSGGQHVNKTDSAVIVKHKPSGLQIRSEASRSQHQNRDAALALLRARLLEAERSAAVAAENGARKAHVGSGMRGDKRRTIRYQDAIVTDHVLDVKVPLKDYLRGDFGPLLK